ncbi:tungsten formylmethanofuran dehydrogenase [Flavobacterium branchiophilum NBRC 15030 = ATCC 35035]|uniref:3-methyl-2-oxobutanoate dehydrogenase (2-methylpropanoyl-transferring) n=1 Tax=Flavobacterium branchiophilum TaxID=55197 RepID=A0A543G7E8_9FLAO|nr:alpha-ketoacid dehydrogenase subunit alpha/beta [Flavobacterium branchiophilum]OXA71969.1 tungsten formylmethanofuran dehydrogenase [Flavobacterium branchiophilum NBRC 15030 = ATCC 35035]TQM42009.1 2-oxoisovalerate dehydrogenase E1 component [Flavobacterium branchiophilum]GEM53780.1 oxoisovalerate dehydrogenase subunits alpha/beta [Flavobacterium branchiophilum NBRC 15030 = ATCC 35035]
MLDIKILKKAFSVMATAKAMTQWYEVQFKLVSKYVHATSRGHEAIQIALAMQLLPQDFVYPYYRDDAMLLGMDLSPYQLMLQLMAKKDDPFSGGRTYYCHPSLNEANKPKIPHQSSATGMQAIPATGAAMGFWYKEKTFPSPEGKGFADEISPLEKKGLVVCSLGDAAVTEGEVAEALQMAALKQLPILYLIQDNGWDISANAHETRAQNAFEYAKGFHGIEALTIDGSDFSECYTTLQKVINTIRVERRPFLVHAKVPLLNHHTSGVRMEWYRDDLEEAKTRDPYPIIIQQLIAMGCDVNTIQTIEQEAVTQVQSDFEKALHAADPVPGDLFTHDFAPTPIMEETGNRNPMREDKVMMVDCALFAVEELMKKHPECLLYGQDVGARLGGVFREAATLAQKFGNNRVFNTPIQEAFIVGSTVGMSAVGLKPIVEVQFADYIWPALNQLFTEVSRSCYLSNGKWPVSMILRVPIGAYGSGGPYHSSSIESILTNIRGIKIAYPSNGADLKGLLKAAYYDPNPVVILEHKGLYWSKVKGTDAAKVNEPSEDYILPFGKANLVQEIWPQETQETLTVITYGMGVHWALNASENLKNQVEIIDLRTLYPLDELTVFKSVQKTKKCLVLTEEPVNNSFARSLAGLIQEQCFQQLDAPVMVLGAENMPAIPLNSILEQTMLPNIEKVRQKMEFLLQY